MILIGIGVVLLNYGEPDKVDLLIQRGLHLLPDGDQAVFSKPFFANALQRWQEKASPTLLD